MTPPTTAESNSLALVWAERPLAEIIRLAWPIAVSMLSYATMTLVDTFFVGRLGPASLAGVGLGGVVSWALCCFPLGLTRGAKVLVSQAVGAGENQEVPRILAATQLFAMVLGAVTIAIGLALVPLVPLLAASESAGAAASDYFGIRLLGAPMLFLFWGTREVRQGLGDSRRPMACSIAANIINLVLDYLFIVEWGLGVEGAATASVIACTAELVLLMVLARTPSSTGIPWRQVGGLWWVGWPSGLDLLVEIGSFTALSLLVSRYSEIHMAAHQIALQVIHFSFLPAYAVSDAACVMAGQAVGAKRLSLVLRVATLAMVAAGVYTGLCSLTFALGGGMLAGVFSASGAVTEVATHLLWMAAAFQVADGGCMVARGILRGVGDVRFPMMVSAMVAWGLTPPSMWLLGYKAGWGAVGGWMGLTVELVITCTVLWLRLYNGGWRQSAHRTRAVATEQPNLLSTH